MAKIDYSQFDRDAPQMIADLKHDFGLQDWQAAAFPGNAAHESAYFTDIVEDGAIAKGMAGGTGWFQWTGLKSRRGAFEAWLRRKKLFGFKSLADAADSYIGNYSFLFRELKGPEARVVSMVRAARSLEHATQIVCDVFERPAVRALPARIAGAKRALEKYRANPPKPTDWAAHNREDEPMTTPVPANPPAIPWYKSPVFTGAAGALASAGLLVVSLWQPGKGVGGQSQEFYAAVVALVSALGALYSRFTATAQPITLTQPAADKIAAEKRAEEAERVMPAGPVVIQAPTPITEMPLSQVVDELPRVIEALSVLAKGLGPLGAIIGTAAPMIAERVREPKRDG